MTATGPPKASTRTAAGPTVPDRPERPPAHTVPGSPLRKLRWGVRAALTVGVAASVAANILHADPHPVSQVIAAWPPLALALTVELIARVPVHRRALAIVRLLSTAAIAGIAAWVSYFHMAGVVSRYGETGTVPYLLPLSVDGLVIVASISLVELAGRIQDSEKPAGDRRLSTRGGRSVDVAAEHSYCATPDSTAVIPVPVSDLDRAATSPQLNGAAPTTVSTSHTEGHDDLYDGRLVRTPPSPDTPHRADVATSEEHDTGAKQVLAQATFTSIDEPPAPAAEPRSSDALNPATMPPVEGQPPSNANGDRSTTDGQPPDRQSSPPATTDDVEHDHRGDSSAHDDMPATAAAIAAWLRSDPTLQPVDVAIKIDRSLRTVRRHWRTAVEAQPANDIPPSHSRDAHDTRDGVGE